MTATRSARTRSYSDTNAVDQFPGVVRRTLASGERLTLIEVRIEPGAEVPEHTHPHEQAGHVAAGRVRFRIGRPSGDGHDEHELGPGDSYLIPSELPHHVQAVDAVTLIEVFSPVREDFAE